MKKHFLTVSTLLLIAGGIMTNAYAGSGANTIGLTKLHNQLTSKLRVATSCQGLGQWQVINVGPNATETATVTSDSSGSTMYADVPGFANCTKFTARNGKAVKFYDDKGKLGISEK
ncbi:hypothetical protein [Herminiimonas sp. KBW02]|uniref:hypothetical protein n=1 Tax=Herminiimonas sp. KBW02 TaxID=2153363 RepID=UPI000F5A7FCE|nr:hypothetical protein [Herminiimonas sp. KBW02]